jgi:DNA-binding transcriptional ArsR family regulator
MAVRRRPAPTSRAQRELQAIDDVFRALAHAARREILLVIHFRGGSMTAGQIAGRFGCAWPTTTRHLRVLEESGLVRVEKRGRERVYSIDAQRLRDVAGSWLGWFGPPVTAS